MGLIVSRSIKKFNEKYENEPTKSNIYTICYSYLKIEKYLKKNQMDQKKLLKKGFGRLGFWVSHGKITKFYK